MKYNLSSDNNSKLREELVLELIKIINHPDFLSRIKAQYDNNKFDGFIGINHPSKSDDNEILMSVYNLQELSVDSINEVNRIKSDRNYNNFFHFNSIKNKNTSLNHYDIEIDSNKIYWDNAKRRGEKVLLNKNENLYINLKKGSDKIKSIEFSEELKEKVDENEELRNLCDIVFFDNNTTKVLAIPIPFFSTPTIIVVIKNDDFTRENKETLIRGITTKTRKAVEYYVQSVLLSKLFSGEISNLNNIKNEIDFINWFIEQINEILLPISYKIISSNILAEGEKIIYKQFLSENSNEEFSFVNFNLNFSDKSLNIDIECEIQLKLKSFIYPKFRTSINSASWFHQIEDFKPDLQIDFIESVFQTICKSYFTNYNSKKQLRKHIVKATIANIIAKGMAHTDASHSMKYYESFLLEESSLTFKSNFPVYNTHLRNLMDYTADVTGGLGQQTFFNIHLNEFISDIVLLFSKKEPTGLTNIEILSKGLNDGEAFSVLTYKSNLDLFVSIPGGESGKAALLSIIKGFFRNLYKHSSPEIIRNEKVYEIAINTYELNKIKNETSVKSNERIISENYCKIELIEKSNQYSKCEIEDIVLYINTILGSELYNLEEDRISTESWGLREMILGASYLIGLPFEEYDGLKIKNAAKYFKLNGRFFPYPFFYVEKNDLKNGLYSLKYSFFLLKGKILNKKPFENKKELKETIGFEKRHSFSILNDYQYLKYFNIKVLSESDLVSYNSLNKNLQTEDMLHKIWFSKFMKSKINDEEVLKDFDNEVLYYSKGYSNSIDNIKYIFDDHIEFFNKYGIKGVCKLDYYEYIGTYNKTGLFESDLSKNNNGININFQSYIKEVILTKVAIIDERFQKNINKENDKIKCFKQYEIYKLKNIFIPQKLTSKNSSSSFDFNCFNISEVYKEDSGYNKILNILEYYFITKDCDYVLIHFSGIEKILRNKYIDKPLNDSYHCFITDLYKRDREEKLKNKTLILVSGKGTPMDIPNNSFYLSLQNIEYALNKSKFHLVKLLNNVRNIIK